MRNLTVNRSITHGDKVLWIRAFDDTFSEIGTYDFRGHLFSMELTVDNLIILRDALSAALDGMPAPPPPLDDPGYTLMAVFNKEPFPTPTPPPDDPGFTIVAEMVTRSKPFRRPGPPRPPPDPGWNIRKY